MATAPARLSIVAEVGESFDTLAAWANPDTRAAYIDGVIARGVEKATCYYAAGRPGRGAYELARLACRVNRLLDQMAPS